MMGHLMPQRNETSEKEPNHSKKLCHQCQQHQFVAIDVVPRKDLHCRQLGISQQKEIRKTLDKLVIEFWGINCMYIYYFCCL
jgi:hypothetical protein